MKKKLAFVFFGQNRNDKYVLQQINNIRKAEKNLSDYAEFSLFDCSRNGFKNELCERVVLDGLKNEKEIFEEWDPLAKFREDKKRKNQGGWRFATIYIQAKDYLQFVNLRKDIDFVFRLRTDCLVDSELICKAVKEVFPKNTTSPYRILQNKAWVQFAHLLYPFYLHDTAFLVSRYDLLKISEECLNSTQNYPSRALPCNFWGPIFLKNNNLLINYFSYFYNEYNSIPKVKLNSHALNLLPLYWKYLSANFYINHNPPVEMNWAYREKPEKRSWRLLPLCFLKNLSIKHIYFLYKICDCVYIEESLDYLNIKKICSNKDLNIKGLFMLGFLTLNAVIKKILHKLLILKTPF